MHLQEDLLTHKRERERERKKKRIPGKRFGLGEPALSVFRHVTEFPATSHTNRKYHSTTCAENTALVCLVFHLQKKSNNNMTAVLSDVAMVQHAFKECFWAASYFLVSIIRNCHQRFPQEITVQKHRCPMSLQIAEWTYMNTLKQGTTTKSHATETRCLVSWDEARKWHPLN